MSRGDSLPTANDGILSLLRDSDLGPEVLAERSMNVTEVIGALDGRGERFLVEIGPDGDRKPDRFEIAIVIAVGLGVEIDPTQIIDTALLGTDPEGYDVTGRVTGEEGSGWTRAVLSTRIDGEVESIDTIVGDVPLLGGGGAFEHPLDRSADSRVNAGFSIPGSSRPFPIESYQCPDENELNDFIEHTDQGQHGGPVDDDVCNDLDPRVGDADEIQDSRSESKQKQERLHRKNPMPARRNQIAIGSPQSSMPS